jgi:hypothetical protein
MDAVFAVKLAGALFLGAGFGIFFFRGLSGTIAAVLARKGTSATALLSFPVRLCAAALVFGGCAAVGGMGAVLSALAGFSCVQAVFLVRAAKR